MRKYIIILSLIIILLSCSRKEGNIESKINFTHSWIEPQSASVVHFDSTFLYINNVKYPYYKISENLLVVLTTVENYCYFDLPSENQIYRIDHISCDSLILSPLYSLEDRIMPINLRFYNKDLIYDSIINLQSIEIKNSVPGESLLINKDSIFVLKDESFNMYNDSLVYYSFCISKDQFNYVQEIIRCIDIENMDTVLPTYIQIHDYWTINVKYNNKTKSFAGVCLSPAFLRIWCKVFYESQNVDFIMMK